MRHNRANPDLDDAAIETLVELLSEALKK